MKSCNEVYPDIFTDPSKVPASEQPAVLQKNEERRRLYLATRFLLGRHFAIPESHLPENPADFPPPLSGPITAEQKLTFLGVYGLLQAKNFVDPSMGRNPNVPAGPDDLSIDIPLPVTEVKLLRLGSLIIVPRFVEAMVESVKEFTAHRALFDRILPVLQEEGRTRANGEERTTVYTRQLAEVARRLVEERASPLDPQLKLRILNALSLAIGSRVDGNASAIDITLVDLDAGTAVDIIGDHLKAAGGLYFTGMLEEMKLFAVADKVAEHFMTGMLPLGRGPGGERVYKYVKETPNRFTEVERRSMYARSFGLAQGNSNEQLPNREFSDLWIRFLSAVSLLSRQGDAERTLVSEEQALKAARDLSVNLSLHGYGVAYFAAVELQNLVRDVKEMLQNAEVLSAYGVRDVWQLVDRVSTLYLGGSVNGVRYRTMAQSGGEIILWLARKAPLLASASRYASGLFTEVELVNHVERWLAVTGTPDSTVEKFSEPMDVKAQPTIPTLPSQLMVPDSVRNALNQVTNGIQIPGLPQA
ncbi:hypothetical protein P2318_16625 [Myxococcaceae bacterium GXIMD 01537]